MFYVYIYLDPRKPGKYYYSGLNISFLFEPYYVGKGSWGREFSRLNRSHHFLNKLDKLKRLNLDPYILKIYETDNEISSYKYEKDVINKIGRLIDKGPLINIASGGIGPGLSGELNGMFGYHHSDEARQKISEANKNKIVSEDTRILISKSLTGRVWSKESKDRLKETLKTEHWVYQHKRKGIYYPREPKCWTEETKEKIRGDKNPMRNPEINAKFNKSLKERLDLYWKCKSLGILEAKHTMSKNTLLKLLQQTELLINDQQ